MNELHFNFDGLGMCVLENRLTLKESVTTLFISGLSNDSF